MEVIDDEGRLFGVVNVVDAVAVLLVVAVVVAGASLVLGGEVFGSTDTETRTVTLAFGPQSPQVATAVEPGNVTVNGVSTTITDVYRTPAGGGKVLLFVRLQVPGRSTDAGFMVDGTTLRYGSEVAVETPEYALTGVVDAIRADERFDTATRSVTVEANVTRAVADSVTAGDTHHIDDVAVATVTDVEATGGNEKRRTLVVTMELRGRQHGGTFSYAGSPVRLGSRLSISTHRYQFTGEVVDIDDV